MAWREGLGGGAWRKGLGGVAWREERGRRVVTEMTLALSVKHARPFWPLRYC